MRNDYRIEGDTTIIYAKRRHDKIYEILVDTEDLELIKENVSSVQVHISDKNIYARCILKSTKKQIPLHRFIMCPPYEMYVDHKFHDGLDNRKKYLRICTPGQNSQNTKARKKNTRYGDVYRGVQWQMSTGKYRASVTIDGVLHKLGTYDTPEEANEVVVAFRRKHLPFSTI